MTHGLKDFYLEGCSCRSIDKMLEPDDSGKTQGEINLATVLCEEDLIDSCRCRERCKMHIGDWRKCKRYVLKIQGWALVIVQLADGIEAVEEKPP